MSGAVDHLRRMLDRLDGDGLGSIQEAQTQLNSAYAQLGRAEENLQALRAEREDIEDAIEALS